MSIHNDLISNIDTDAMSGYTNKDGALARTEHKPLRLLPYRKTNTYCQGLFDRNGKVYKFLSTNGNKYVPAQVKAKCVLNNRSISLSEGEIAELRSLLNQ